MMCECLQQGDFSIISVAVLSLSYVMLAGQYRAYAVGSGTRNSIYPDTYTSNISIHAVTHAVTFTYRITNEITRGITKVGEMSKKIP